MLERFGSDLLVRHIDLLRESVRMDRAAHPFATQAWVELPEHLQCAIKLPIGVTDFSLRWRWRWRLIENHVSKSLPKTELLSATRLRRSEREIWERRFWEHLIRNEKNFSAHMDYVHINPLKHGLVTSMAKSPYSTFHRLVEQGVYPANWARGDEGDVTHFD